MPSIISAALAREISAEIANGVAAPSASAGKFTLFAHRSRRGGWGEHTGGLLLTLSLDAPAYGGPNSTFSTRLRPGWTAASLARAVHRIGDAALAEKRRQDHAEAVYLRSPQNVPDSFVAAVEGEERQSGRSCVYAQMSADDAAHWLAWLAANPAAQYV